MTEVIVSRPLHIRVSGRTQDLTLADLDLAPDAAPDRVMSAVARHLGVNEAALARDHQVVIEGGATFVRPNAIYG